MNYLLIDTSYLIFYRYFALLKWWSHAKPDIPLAENPYECKEFLEKFEKMMLESIQTIKKRLKIHKESCKVFAAKDCPRQEIWRNKLYENYKENRDYDKFMGGQFFKHVYANDNKILTMAGIDNIFKLNNLEADDIIAILKNNIRKKHPDDNIYIITNDHDYLQLLDEKTNIINLQFKNLKELKSTFPESDKNLFFKIILGDKSDNITPVFKKCGVKTVEKYYLDKELFEKDLDRYNCREKFYKNREIISFDYIPKKYIENFIEEYSIYLG